MSKGRKPLPKKKREKIQELRKQGNTYKQISKKLNGVSQYTAHKYGKLVTTELQDQQTFKKKRYNEGKYIPTQDDLMATYRLLTGSTIRGSKKEILEAIKKTTKDLDGII